MYRKPMWQQTDEHACLRCGQQKEGEGDGQQRGGKLAQVPRSKKHDNNGKFDYTGSPSNEVLSSLVKLNRYMSKEARTWLHGRIAHAQAVAVRVVAY